MLVKSPSLTVHAKFRHYNSFLNHLTGVLPPALEAQGHVVLHLHPDISTVRSEDHKFPPYWGPPFQLPTALVEGDSLVGDNLEQQQQGMVQPGPWNISDHAVWVV